MSTPTPLPGRLNQIPRNSGYQTPPCVDLEVGLSKQEAHRQSDLRRNTWLGDEGLEAANTGMDMPNHVSDAERKGNQSSDQTKYGYRDRISCYTWTFFTSTMATGGMANVLHSIPFRSEWLRIIGSIIMFFNMGLFVMNCFFLTLRFMWNPGTFRSSFTRPKESLFVPACVVSAGTILINICQYGIPETGQWLQTTMQIFFWLYAAVAFLASASIYLIIWSTQAFPVHTMTPIWIFPAYPLLLIAPFAANLIDALPDAAAAAQIDSIAIAFGAVSIQGTGFLISLMIYGAFIYRLMTQKLPKGGARPGMFVSVGPSGFTVAGIVLLGDTLPKIMPNGYRGHPDAPFFLQLLAFIVGLWLWGLCVWFFIVSVGAHHKFARPDRPKNRLEFDMTWFSFVFPNTAFVTATQAIAKAFDSHAMKIVATVMSGLLVALWLLILGVMIKSFWAKKLLWPDETEPQFVFKQPKPRNTD